MKIIIFKTNKYKSNVTFDANVVITKCFAPNHNKSLRSYKLNMFDYIGQK